VVFLARWAQGRSGEIIEMLEQTVSSYPRIPAFRAGLANVLCWLDRREEAAAIVEAAAADRFAHVTPKSDSAATLALYAEAAAQTRLVGAASILYELIEPWKDHCVWVAVLGYGHARMYLGQLAAALGDNELAEQHLAFACDFHEENGLLLWAARTHLLLAETLASRGDARAAREHASRALELSREHGYGAFEPRAAALAETESAAGT
jgi:tetratricopeptide (TPR) repeat protein